MASHSSATAREHTPRTFNPVTNNSLNQIAMRDALRRRADSLIQDRSIDGSSRAIIRYAQYNIALRWSFKSEKYSLPLLTAARR